MKAEIHRGKAVPPGVAFREWRNITGGELVLQPPGLLSFRLCPDGRLQIPCADLAMVPMLEPWLEGLELRGTLRQSDPIGA
jgi:hypothetical protein